MYCNTLRYIANAILLPLQKTCDIDYCASLVHGIGDLLNYCPTLVQTSKLLLLLYNYSDDVVSSCLAQRGVVLEQTLGALSGGDFDNLDPKKCKI